MTANMAASPNQLPATVRLGPVTLQVADLGRSLTFYGDLLGLEVHAKEAATVSLGAADGVPLITLREHPGARPVPRRGRLGLFHLALLLPTRADLGSLLRHLGASGVPLGMADHLFSEALYLTDPDGLGLELYADRPRDAWQRVGGELVSDTLPLDIKGLLGAAGDEPYRGIPAGTTVGHVHFHVGNLAEAASFYEQGLGFEPTITSFPGARFVSAGGYHHHVGFNIWAAGVPVAEVDDARLLEWRLELPSKTDLDSVTARLSAAGYTVDTPDEEAVAVDPWHITVRLTVA